jgi:hypothetical protein
MRRWFLGYNSYDLEVALAAAHFGAGCEANFTLRTQKPASGAYWMPELAQQIAEATAFVLLAVHAILGKPSVLAGICARI